MKGLPNQERIVAANAVLETDELLGALDALQPGDQQKKQAFFAKAYPGILRAIARKVPQKDILATLGRSGLKLHPIRYREMLEAEHKLRGEGGERICCETCGSSLHPPPSDESLAQASNFATPVPDGVVTRHAPQSSKGEAV